MMDMIMDALLDTVKLLPYLLITFIVLEFIEHKFDKRNKNIMMKSKKVGPIAGGVLGALPQCGFSSMASSLFSARVITMGTLIAVFLSTSDEMLPIMISEQVEVWFLVKVLLFKALTGIIVGYIIDLIYRKKTSDKEEIKDLCESDHCECEEHGIILSSIIHTIKIGVFILFANLLIGLILFYVGEDNVSNVLLNNNIFTYFISSLIGLVPNCAGSVIITELYLSNLISLGTMLSGLLTGSGLGILLLFKTNKNVKENITILSIIYFVGVLIGMLVDLVI